jgi:chemotaxis protein methyltransferase CheR
MIRLLPDEQKSLAQYVYSLCAITLDESKGYLIESRLASLVEDSGCTSYGGLLQLAKADISRALERKIIDAITTNETSFFRDISPFDLLRHKLVPELVDRRARTGAARIRIWSAACSTGQELYSIAILLKELLGDTDRYGIRLFGTDISNDAVARASRGLFSPVEISRGLSEAQRSKYFNQVGGGLMADFSSLGRFDVIFCRNVAIYFTEKDRIALFGRLERALEPGGYLVIGAMESLNGICPQFESKRHLRSVFYQVKARHEATSLR